MRILSQTNDIKGYHGTIGTPTNMYDYRGEQLFVGDVVCLATFGVDGKKAYDFGIEFVCEEKIQALQIGQAKIINMLWALQALITMKSSRCLTELN